MDGLFYHYTVVDTLSHKLLFDSTLLFDSCSACAKFGRDSLDNYTRDYPHADVYITCLFLLKDGERDN